MKKTLSVSLLIFLLSFGVTFAQDEAPAVQPISVEVVEESEAPVPELYGHMKDKRGMHGKWKHHKKGWHNKSFGEKIAYKGSMGVMMLVFLFLGAFAVRRGWDMGKK